MGWMVLGSNSTGSEIFYTLPDGPQGDHPAAYKMGTRSFLGSKRLGHGTDHPPPASTEVKEREKPYLYSPSVLWLVLG